MGVLNKKISSDFFGIYWQFTDSFCKFVSNNIDVSPWKQAKREMLDDKTKKAPQTAKLFVFTGRVYEIVIESLDWRFSQIK